MSKLEQLNQTISTRNLGEFTINSNAIRFTDPCGNVVEAVYHYDIAYEE